MSIVSNISGFDRQLRGALKSVMGTAGGQVAYAAAVAFEELVRETPQWSGETAASWSMGFLPGDNPRMRVKEKPPLEEALSRGMQPAVNIAMTDGLSTMSTNNLEDYLYKDLIVTNPSPQLEIALKKEGASGLRPINEPGADLDKFENTVKRVLAENR